MQPAAQSTRGLAFEGAQVLVHDFIGVQPLQAARDRQSDV